MKAATVALAVVLVVAACSNGTTPSTPTSTAPGSAAPVLERGAALYAANCAECHGADLRGTDSGPSFFSEVYRPDHHADGAFLFAVLRGSPSHHWRFGDMPPVPGLDAEDVEAIVAFVRDAQSREGFEPYPP